MVFTFFNKNNSYAVAVMLYELCFNRGKKKKSFYCSASEESPYINMSFLFPIILHLIFTIKSFFYYYYIKRNIAFDHQSTYFIRLNEISELSTFGQGQ